MKLHNRTSEIFVPDGKPLKEALARTTHMGVGAHPDDLEIMAYDGILKCFGSGQNWFFGVTVTNGAGSPRSGLYARYTDMEMQKVRRVEQKKSAVVGEYSALAFLDYSSPAAKDPENPGVLEDLKSLFKVTTPSVVYTHNPADKHDTHVAVALKTIHALRELPHALKPKQVLGCEVWRDFDWMTDKDKIALDVSPHENLAAALLGVYDSQISGGKRYDIGTMGRRRANATYYASHGVDTSTYLIYAMDLTPLIKDPKLSIELYIRGYIERFCDDVLERIGKLGY